VKQKFIERKEIVKIKKEGNEIRRESKAERATDGREKNTY